MDITSRKEILSKIKEFQKNCDKVKIISICEKLGIEVYQASMDKEISGAILLKDKTNEMQQNMYEIYVNRDEPRNRQRFTIAHELAHFILHEEEIEKNLTDIKGSKGSMYRSKLSNTYETQANILASEILMPINLIKKHIDSGIRIVSKLADKLGVPEEDLRKRLDNLENVFLEIPK